MVSLRRRGLCALGGAAALVAALVATAAPAGATDVADAAQYLAAFGNAAETDITLTADITFTCPSFASRISATPLTIHGQGHTIHGCATGLNHSAIADVNFENVTLDGGTLVLSTIGDVTLTDSTITSTSAATVLGVSIIGNVDLTRTQIGPLNAPGSVLAMSTIGDLTVNGSTIGPATSSTSSVIGISTIGDTSIVDSNIASITAATSALGVSVVTGPGEQLQLVRSTIDGVAGAVTTLPLSGVSEDVSVVNSTISNNAGPVSLVADTASFVYSDIVENAGFTAGVGSGALRDVQLPPLPEDAPEGMKLAEPQLSDLPTADAGALQVDAQLAVDGPTAFFGTVVALPQGGAVNCDVVPPATSNGYNFSDDDTCNFTSSGDRENAGDPLLGALGNNGGPTPTRLPLTGSPLLDFIPLAACQNDGAAGITDDQRLLARPSGPGCEIGSVEVQAVILVVRFTG